MSKGEISLTIFAPSCLPNIKKVITNGSKRQIDPSNPWKRLEKSVIILQQAGTSSPHESLS
jgi:hypothetical protein